MVSILPLLLPGCSGKRTAKITEEETVLLSPYMTNLGECASGPAVAVNLSEVAQEIGYVALETTPACLLKRVYQHAFYNNTILVSDFSNLYQFNNQGTFMGKIGSKGSGPADYTYITTIIKNDDASRFYLFTRGKINIYDEKVDFLQSVPFSDRDLPVYCGIMLSPEEFLVYLGSSFKVIGDTTSVYSLAKVNVSGQVICKLPNRSPIDHSSPGMVAGAVPLYRFDNAIRFMDYGCDTLCTLTAENEFIPYAICSLGAMKCDPKIGGSPQELEALSSKLRIETVCEDHRFLYITLEWGVSGKYQYILFDKKTGQTRNVGNEGLVNDLDGGLPFFPQQIEKDGTMIMWVTAEALIEKIEKQNHSKLKEQYGAAYENISQLASRLSPDDNHILITTHQGTQTTNYPSGRE